jgi:hypothetical protein
MIESQVRALFAEIADGEPVPSRVDIPLARRRGRARLRWRRACVAGGSVLAAAAVAALAVGVGSVRPGSGPPAARPAALRQFNPLVPYLSFGWLPAGNSLVAGGARPKVSYLTAGRTKTLGPSTWGLSVYAAGQCHVTSPARELKCSTQDLEGLTARITGPAPAVRGHRAFWAGSFLVWQYARGGWAWLSLPYPYDIPKLSNPAQREAAQRDAVKIADHVRYGAPTPPLVFPVQLTRLPSRWRVSSVYYLPDAGVLRASRFALGTGNPDLGADGGLEYQTNLPYFNTDPASRKGYCYRAPNRKNSSERSTSETINGYRVVVTHQVLGTLPRQDLCAAHAAGLALYISQFGAHPPISLTSLFRDHLRLLGTNPANWTSKPIG